MVVPWNPCGAVCDYLDSPYTTKIKPFAGSDVEVDQIWYPARDDAPALPFASAFGSRTWYGEDDWMYHGPGEVYDAPRVYNGERRKLGARGGHVCGTAEQFAGKAVYDPDAVPVLYDEEGLPVCCGAPRVMPGRGAGRGELEATYIPPGVTPGNTCETAGAIEMSVEYEWPGDLSENNWWVVPVTPSEVYHVTASAVGSFSLFSVFTGPNCGPTKVLQGNIVASGGCLSTAPDTLGFFLWVYVNLTEIGVTYTFRVDPGFCP